MSITPLNDRLIVKKSEPTLSSSFGIQGSPHLRLLTGEVVSVSERVYTAGFQPGDIVMFSPFSAVSLSIQGEEHFLIKESDLLALIDDGEALMTYQPPLGLSDQSKAN